MDFHKLILDFCKSCNEIGQKHFGPYLKNKAFKHWVYNENCNNVYLQLVLKNEMAEFFEKKKQKKKKKKQTRKP